MSIHQFKGSRTEYNSLLPNRSIRKGRSLSTQTDNRGLVASRSGLHKNHPPKIVISCRGENKNERVHIKLLIDMHKLITLRIMKAKRIAVYGRVSTDGQSHASQLREVRAYVRRRWPKAEVTEYLDKASGASFSREGLDALMAEVRQGRVDILAVYKLDRLGRSLQHLAQLIGEFEAHGTALVATSQGIDTSESNPAGRLQMHVLAAVAEFERSVIRERINAGLAAARERGTNSAALAHSIGTQAQLQS